MAEVAFEGICSRGYAENLEWGLDGWTNQDTFDLLITLPDDGAKASLNYEQCSMLAAALIEHMKEVKDAEQENIVKD